MFGTSTGLGMRRGDRGRFRLALSLQGLVLLSGLLSFPACDYFEPDPLPPRGDEWVVDAIRREAAGESGRCGAARKFYRDKDGDGFGDPKHWVEGCVPPSGYVQNSEDCYDDNPDAYPGQTESFATDRGDGSFDYDCDGTQSKRMTNRAYCVAKEDGSGCRSASGWLERKVPKCGQPGRWKWYECVTLLYRPESEPARDLPAGRGPTGSGTESARPSVAPGPRASGAAPADFKKRFVCKGRELPWKKRQLCR